MEMSPSDIVKTIQLFIKDKEGKKSAAGNRICNQVTFNSSDALLITAQSLFYTQLINLVKKTHHKIDGREQLDYILANQETMQDPEDLVYDILQGMGDKEKSQQVAKD